MNLLEAKRGRGRRRSSVTTGDVVRLRGGLNLVESFHDLKPGELLISKNYEPYFASGAYQRVGGYEAFDGRARPHKAEYWKVELAGITGGPFALNETVTATPSGRTGIVVRYVVDETLSDDTGYLIVTDLSDEVDEGEVWTGGTSGATGTGVEASALQGEIDEDLHDTAQLAAENYRRSFIEAVGGTACSGPTRGVRIFLDNIYGFRDNAAGTAGSMWRATAAGWVQVDLGYKIRFTSGTAEPQIGDTVTGASSSASCVVKKLVVTDGWWSSGNARGYIIATEVTGGPFTGAESLQIDAATWSTSAGNNAQEAQTLPAGGKYRFRNHNFGGNSATFAMYGVNGVGNAFEYDGETFTLIETGMVNDLPDQVGVHRGHLLLAFPGGSLQHSGKNQPLSWQPVTGANEILAGDEITGFLEEINDVTFVFTRNQTYRLEGYVQENIQLKLQNSETGAIANTMQRIGRSIYLDDRGFTNLPTTSEFGDFGSNQLSLKIEPLLQQFLAESTVDDSVIHRGKSLYRCFFSNSECIVMCFSGNRVSGITTIDYNMRITATDNGEIQVDGENNGQERVFVGSEDGFVYETDVGRNFNGDPIEYYIVPAYHFSGSPEYQKRYRRVTIYAEGNGRISLTVYGDYDYNETTQNFETIMDRSVPLGGGRYGISRHGSFVYSSSSKTDIRVPMDSHGRNVSLIFYGRETNEEPHILYSMTFHVSQRQMMRR